MKYNPSINIEYGIDKDFHYIVTPNAQAVTGELVSNFHSGIHSFSIIGTYGTGKSSYLMALERDLMEVLITLYKTALFLVKTLVVLNASIYWETIVPFQTYWQTNFIATDLMILRIFSQHYQSIMLK